MKKSIVIGSNGYLGRHLSFFLDKNGFENANYDIHPQGIAGQKNYHSLDITNKSDIKKLNPDVDYIFLFAGLTGTIDGFEKYNEFISANEIGLLNILSWIQETKSAVRIIFPSTRLVYKGNNHPLKEEDPKQAKTIYAANKLAAEQILWMYQNAFGINYTVFRICVPYGNVFDNSFSYGTIGFLLRKATKAENISLYGDGLIMRTFSHVEDICLSIINTLNKRDSENEIYNIGGEDLSLLFVARLIAEKYKVNVEFKDWPEMDLKLESGDTIFDSTKLDSLIQYNSTYRIQDWVSGL